MQLSTRYKTIILKLLHAIFMNTRHNSEMPASDELYPCDKFEIEIEEMVKELEDELSS